MTIAISPGTAVLAPATAARTWFAVLLAIVASPFAFLYVRRPGWFWIHLLLALLLGLSSMWFGLRYEVRLALIIVVVIQVWVFAPQAQYRPARWYSAPSSLLLLILGVFVLFVSLRAFLFEPFRLPTSSMQPGLPAGSLIVVGKWGYGHHSAYGLQLWHSGVSAELRRGDVLVYEVLGPQQQATYLSRLLGLPGERIAVRQGQVWIDGEALAQHDLPDAEPSPRRRLVRELDWIVEFDQQPGGLRDMREVQLAADEVFFMSDHRDWSVDSRTHGPQPMETIIGKVVWAMPSGGAAR